jgi:2-polyprenyl-3-methyl-5-hydroxy-6-metoxy-1,4-benzoquinol methylase
VPTTNKKSLTELPALLVTDNRQVPKAALAIHNSNLLCQISQFPYISPMTNHEATNTTKKNRTHYDRVYAKVSIAGIIKKLQNLEDFLADATNTDTSWVCMYVNNFKDQLNGKRILELGCGDCTNAAVMAALGAEVVANDISDRSGDIIEALNNSGILEEPIHYIQGDFLLANLPKQSFDMVIGKAFIHHLDHETEEAFYQKIIKLLKPHGEARFVEPAVNSHLLDTLRWMVPVPGRPSSFQKAKFKQWQEADPHPHRDNSSQHYQHLGKKYFKNVAIIPIGSIERLNRLFPRAKWNRKFRRGALKFEQYLPHFLTSSLARSQTIIFSDPIT